MMEAPHVQACAQHITRWFAQPQRNRRTRYDAVRLPKTRVLIVGAKFGEMYLNAFMQPRRGWNWSACWRREALVQESGSCVWHSAVYLAGTDNQDAGIACIVVRSTVAGGTGTQLANTF